MKRTLKLSILGLCLILIAGIFMGTFAGATDTLTQPQCVSSSDAPVSQEYHPTCHDECVRTWCNQHNYYYDYCKFRCYLYCPIW